MKIIGLAKMSTINLKKTQKASHAWDRFSDDYVSIFEPLTTKVGISMFNSLMPFLPNKPLRIVELGCGSGMLAEQYLKSGIAIKQVCLFDISKEMREKSKNKINRMQNYEKVEILDSSHKNLTAISSQSIDLVFAHLLLNVVDDYLYFLDFIKRVLTKDGLLSCSMNSDQTVNSYFDFYDECMKVVNPEIYNKYKFKYELGNLEESKQVFEKNGFRILLQKTDQVFIPWNFTRTKDIMNLPINKASTRLLNLEDSLKLKDLLDVRLENDEKKGVQPNLLQNTFLFGLKNN